MTYWKGSTNGCILGWGRGGVEFLHCAFTMQGPLAAHMSAPLQTLLRRSRSWSELSVLLFPSATAQLNSEEVAQGSLSARNTLFPPVRNILRTIQTITNDW